MKLTLIDTSWSAASPVLPDAKVATRFDLEVRVQVIIFTVSIWRYSKISYSRVMKDNALWDGQILPSSLVKRTQFKEKWRQHSSKRTRAV